MIKAPPAPLEKLAVRKWHTPPVVAELRPARNPAGVNGSAKPIAIAQFAGLGDLINMLPVVKAMRDENRTPTTVITRRCYAGVFDRISYASPILFDNWGKLEQDMMAQRFTPVLCNGWEKPRHLRRTANSMIEQWECVHREKDWGKLPVVFDRRNREAERQVLENWPAITKEPYIALSLAGTSSPCPDHDWVRQIVREGAQGTPVIDITAYRCSNPIDLLGLFEKAELLVTIDSGPIHINRATKTPAVLLGRSQDDRWYFAECVENVRAAFTYDTMKVLGWQVRQAISDIVHSKEIPLTVVTGFDSAYRKTGMLCVASIERHLPSNCSLTFEEYGKPSGGRHPSWSKVGLLRQYLQDSKPGEWVVWLDADCIVNEWPPFGQVLRSTPADFVFAADWNGICCALWAVKNTEWSRNMLDTLLLCGDVRDHKDRRFSPDGPKWEQNAVKALVSDFPSVQQHTALFPKEWVCDNPDSDPGRTKCIHHFSMGRWAKALPEMALASRTAA